MTTTTPASAAPGVVARWGVVIAAMLGVAVCSTPIAILSLSVFFIPLGDALGWGRGDVAAAISICALTMGAATPFAGRVIDRIGVKPVLVVSLVAYALTVAATPTIVEHFGLMGFYAAFAAIGILGAGSNTVAYTHVVSAWFDKSRGLALGFTVSGIAVGAVVAPAAAAELIKMYGWQAGFHGLAVLPIVIGLPVALFAIREAPRLVTAEGPAPELDGVSAAEAYRTRTFWTLFAVFVIVATCLHGVQIHLPSLLADRGLSTEASVGAFSLLFAVTAVTRIAAGVLFDRMFAPLVGFFLFVLGGVGIGLVIPTWAPIYYVAGAALIGIATGAETDLLAYLTSRYFGMKAFGQLYGGLFLAFMIGSAIGPYVLGFGFDALGDYLATLTGCVIGMMVAAGMLLTLPKFPETAEAASH